MENNYQAPMVQPQMQPPVSPQPEPKKKNVGLIIAIIAVSLAIVAVSAFGLIMFGGGSQKKVDAILTAIAADDMATATATYADLKDNARQENAAQFASALAAQAKANPYDDTGYNGFNEEDLARFVAYDEFADMINMGAYEPAAAEYIDAVAALEEYVGYNPIVAATLEISGIVIEGLNNCTTGFNYMTQNYMYLGGGYLDDAVDNFDEALALMGNYDMNGLMMQEYHDSIAGMRDATQTMADAGRSGNFTALLAATETYSASIEDFQYVTETMSGVVSDITIAMERVENAYAAL